MGKACLLRLAQYDSALSDHNDALGCVPFDGPREDTRFDITALLHQKLRGLGMIYPFNILFDDRAFIQI